MNNPANRLKIARERAGYNLPSEAAAAMGMSRFTYNQHENGTRGFPLDRAIQYARKFKVSLEWLLTGKEPEPRTYEAQIVGYVGAGAEIHRFDEGVVLETIDVSPNLEGSNVAKVEGDSQYPLQDGWLIFYGPEYHGIPEACVGRLSVVGVKDGPTLLKTLKRGRRKGQWTLESWNAPPREDVRVEWAARVTNIRPT